MIENLSFDNDLSRNQSFQNTERYETMRIMQGRQPRHPSSLSNSPPARSIVGLAIELWPFLVVLAAFALFIALSNEFDWDYFFASAESERRSWLIDHQAPLWSYQFCAGTSRIGDPQAFGLSPLFVPILIFGSVWGWKILIVISAVIGWLYARLLGRLTCQIWSSDPGREIPAATLQLIDLLSTCIVFSWIR
jgi:hypothetical protein